MAIPKVSFIYLGYIVVYKFHGHTTQWIEIEVLSGNKKMEIVVNMKPNAEIELTLKPSAKPCFPFTSKILWVNMACVEDHEWGPWIDSKVQDDSYEAFVFSATGPAMPPPYMKLKAMKMGLTPIITMAGLNSDQGCLVFGASLWVNAELDSKGPYHGPDDRLAHQFNFHVWGLDQ